MSKIILIIIISFHCLGHIYAQPDPITINFVEAQPVWEHLTWDTTYYDIGHQPDLNKYNTANPGQCYRFDNDLILYSPCINFNAEIYGYILEKLDIKTGQIKWQSYNTYYNGGLQDYYKNLWLRPDGRLEMEGIKRHGPYVGPTLGFWNVAGGKSNFVRKIFDYDTGDLVQTNIGLDSIGNIVPQYFNFYPVQFDSTYLALNLKFAEVNDTILYAYDFYRLDHQNNLTDTLPISTIPYETTDSIGVFSLGQPQYTEMLDDTTLIGLIIQDKFHPGKTKAQLIWMNIKDLGDIKVMKRMNIENLIPGEETSFLYFIFKAANNNIYFNQNYFDGEINAVVSYLTILDREGNVLHYIPKCTESNAIYQAVRIVYTSDEYDYFAGFPSRTGRNGLDILKLDRNADSFQFVSSITSAVADEEFTRQMEVSKLYDDGLFVIGAYTKKLGTVENTALKYYCFKGSDLGMQLSTPVKNVVKNEDINVYPNPTDGIINFSFDHNFSGYIVLYDLMGKQIQNHILSGSNTYQIDLGSAPSGIYYASIVDQDSKLMHFEKIIISSGHN